MSESEIDRENTNDHIKKQDQISMLKNCLVFTETGKWNGLFTYPDAGWDLVQQGLVTADKQITIAGRAALWFLDAASDPLPASKVCETFKIALPEKHEKED